MGPVCFFLFGRGEICRTWGGMDNVRVESIDYGGRIDKRVSIDLILNVIVA